MSAKDIILAPVQVAMVVMYNKVGSIRKNYISRSVDFGGRYES